MQTLHTPPSVDLATAIRAFIIDQGEGRTDETRARYVEVADDLTAFLRDVDVTPWLGAEIAHLHSERRRGGADFLPTLGLASFIRVLPAFVADPWLPPTGPQRRTHRAAVRRLMTFLRLRATQEGCLRKEDFKAIDRAIGSASSLDHMTPHLRREGVVSCAVTLDLVEHLLDRLLEQVTEGRYSSLDEAIAARLNPVRQTVWREPSPDYHDHHLGW